MTAAGATVVEDLPQQYLDPDPTPGYERGEVPVGLAIETHGGRQWVCASRGECARHAGRQLLDAAGWCVHCRAKADRPGGGDD